MVQRRGLEIFALAFLFRFQSFVLSHAPLWTMLKVDILNIMGPSIVLRRVAVGAGADRRARAVVAFAAATAASSCSSRRRVRAFAPLAALPDWLEGYLRPIPEPDQLHVLPVDGVRDGGRAARRAARRGAEPPRRIAALNIAFGCGGVALARDAPTRRRSCPRSTPRSSFWTTSASFFFIRLGLDGRGSRWRSLALAPVGEQPADGRPARGVRCRCSGRSSLFIYWIHVEMVYGLISTPLHGGVFAARARGSALGPVLPADARAWRSSRTGGR